MIPPRRWTEQWAREHPRLALLLLAWWLGLAVFVVWMFVDDWVRGIR
jgi:hypothetical protein